MKEAWENTPRRRHRSAADAHTYTECPRASQQPQPQSRAKPRGGEGEDPGRKESFAGLSACPFLQLASRFSSELASHPPLAEEKATAL